MCKKLNGVFAFAIWNDKKQELFLARDHFGIKPLYYTRLNDELVFASEVKAILKHPNCKAVINKEGIEELFGIGPSHTPGISPFKGIKELEPANFIIYSKDKFIKKEYWALKTKNHTDSLEKTCENIRFLLEDSINRQLISDVPLRLFIIWRFRFKYYCNICE